MIFERTIPTWLCLALLGGCIEPPERSDATTSDPPAIDTSKAEGPGAKPAAPAPVATDARAYVNVENVGVHVIDGAGMRMIYPARGPVYDMLTHAGRLFVLTDSGVIELDDEGQAQTRVELDRDDYRELGGPRDFDTIDGQHFWVAGAIGVGRRDGGEWSITKLDDLRKSPPRALALALDHEGSPWLTWGGLHRYQDDHWITAPASAGIPRSVLGLRAELGAKAMLLYSGCTRGANPDRCILVRAQGEAMTRLEFPADPCDDYSLLTLSSNETRAALASACGLVRLDLRKENGAAEQLTTKSGAWTGAIVRSLAIDDGGRIWAGTLDGLVIVDASGERHELPIGQLGDLAGAITILVVTGEGPPPPALGRHRKGGLIATLQIHDDAGALIPIANAKVELCRRPSPRTEPGGSPCDGIEDKLETQTDESGQLRVENVPIGYYHIGVELEDGWQPAVPKVLNMRAGMTGNIGKITVRRR